MLGNRLAVGQRTLDPSAKARAAKELTNLLEDEGVAFDIDANPSAPPGMRIWCGPTIEKADLLALLPWLDWAYGAVAGDWNP